MSSKAQGDQNLPAVLAALDNPHRLRIIHALRGKTNYVSQLARDLGLSRPLLIMHLKKLEEAGLVSSDLEISKDGKAMRFYQLKDFDIHLNPALIAQAAKQLKLD